MTIGHNATVESAGNWIAVSRDIRDHPIVGFGQPVKPADPKRGSYSRTEAWLDLIMQAQFRPGPTNNKGRVIMLARGQLMAARAWLASRWNWTQDTVRWFLDKLERELMVRRDHPHSNPQDRRHYANVLTIENYDIFQTAKELMGMMTPEETPNQPPINPQSTPNQPPQSNKETREQEKKEDSSKIQTKLDLDHAHDGAIAFDEGGVPIILNGKRQALEKILGGRVEVGDALTAVASKIDREGDTWASVVAEVAAYAADSRKRKRKSVPDEYTHDFAEFWKVYPRREGKAAAFAAWQRLSLEQKRRAYSAMKEQLSVLTARLVDRRGNFCPYPATWITQGRFDDELPREAVSKLDFSVYDGVR